MPQQPLSFTIVKTVVMARDGGRALAPAIAVAWEMLRGELGDRARAVEPDVTWGPHDRERLRVVIDGVRDCLGEDPALAREFAVLLEESERMELPGGLAYERVSSAAAVGADDGVDRDVASASEPPPQHAAAAQGPRAAIPMIELSAELIDALGDGGAPETGDKSVDVASQPPDTAPTIACHAEEMPAYAPLDGSADAGPVIPTNLNPVVPRPRLTSAPLAAAAVVGLLGFVAVALYFAFFFGARADAPGGGPSQPPEQAVDVTADVAKDDSPLASLASDAKGFRLAGDYAAALEAQRAYAASLESADAPADTRASAAAALAELSLLSEQPAAAVQAQRDALALRKVAHGDRSPEAADEHLAIASYYAGVDQHHMAQAHYRQARAILRQTPGALNEARASKLRQVGDRLGIPD